MRFCCKYVLDNCRRDMEFMTKNIDENAITRLEMVSSTPFKRLSYTEGIDILVDAIRTKKKKFEKKNQSVSVKFKLASRTLKLIDC